MGRSVHVPRVEANLLTMFSEPASYLHQFSREIVEAKRRNQSNQSIVNGFHAQSLPVNQRQFPTLLRSANGVNQSSSHTLTTPKFPSMVNNATQPALPSQLAPFNFKPTAQPSKRLETSDPAFGVEQPPLDRDFDSKPPLKAPTPQRAKISPVLSFQSPTPVTSTGEGLGGQLRRTSPGRNIQPKFQSPAPFVFSKTSSISGPIHVTKESASPPVQQPLPPSQPEDTHFAELERKARRRSQFERQEKLLRDELARQESERKSKLDLEEQERQNSLAVARQTALERQQVRQKESALLRRQKMATKEREEEEKIESERRKAEREKNIEFYTEEIVQTIVQEHILEVTADVLASGFHRDRLLRRALRHLKKVCARSLKRKRQQLEQISQSRIRKGLLVRALGELDSGSIAYSNKKPRRQSYRPHRETEDFLEEVLLKVLWFLHFQSNL